MTEFSQPAALLLENGDVLRGTGIGASGYQAGEVVFNTAMTGYQEILSDPSYARQIVTLTYPHIGNVGVTPEDDEAGRVYASGLVIRDLPILASNWRMRESLPDYLKRHNVIAIADIDTRKLTRILREQGALRGCIAAGSDIDLARAQAELDAFPGLEGMDLAKEVTCEKPYRWQDNVWQAHEGFAPQAESRHEVVAYDFGVKRNILRLLVNRGCKVTVVPAQTPAKEVLAMKPAGVFLSNGPGDPVACDYAIQAIRELLQQDLPMFGICLGHQLLALALGARTEKMKFGHHGANHPVFERASGKVLITSQNHGFAVAEASLPDCLEPTFHSLFDQSLQGIAHTTKPVFGFQGHPEASPGPHDLDFLFDRFVTAIAAR